MFPLRVAVAIFACTALLILVEAVVAPSGTVPLKEVYTPTFGRVPSLPPVRRTLDALRADLRTPAGHRFLEKMLPDESGVLWLALLLALAIAYDPSPGGRTRNIDLVALQLPALCFFHVLAFPRLLRNPTYLALSGWVFGAVVATTSFLLVRALWRAHRPLPSTWRPALSTKVLVLIAAILVVLDVATALLRPPDDCGFFINLGAQRLRERGVMPYADPMLTGSPGAAYGPVLYFAHLPFQFALAPSGVNEASPPRPVLGPESRYMEPPVLATKLCTVAFHLLGVVALFLIGRRWGGDQIGWALVALYCGSAAVLGVGGDVEMKRMGGMTYISHIAPTALTLAAFALLHRPAFAGGLISLAAGAGFYPAFFVPAWLGFFWSDRRARWRFLAGLATAGALIGISVLLMTPSTDGHGAIAAFLANTYGHHTDLTHYGNSPFGFWGQRTGIRGWLMQPLLANSAFTAPVLLALYGLVVAGFWLARRRSPMQLALVTAALAMASALVKIHATGAYIAWYFPFVLIGLFASPAASAGASYSGAAPSAPVDAVVAPVPGATCG